MKSVLFGNDNKIFPGTVSRGVEDVLGSIKELLSRESFCLHRCNVMREAIVRRRIWLSYKQWRVGDRCSRMTQERTLFQEPVSFLVDRWSYMEAEGFLTLLWLLLLLCNHRINGWSELPAAAAAAGRYWYNVTMVVQQWTGPLARCGRDAGLVANNLHCCGRRHLGSHASHLSSPICPFV